VTGPIYRKFPSYSAHRLGALRWAWEVTDGIGGKLLLSGHALTQSAAEREAANAAGRCEEAIESRLARVQDLFARDGLRFDVSIDEQGRVCVRPECPCSDRDHRRVLLAFCRVVGPVRYETATVSSETEVQAPSAQATVPDATAREAGVA
jgi:hypothetical protein